MSKSLKEHIAEQKAETDRRNAKAGDANDPHCGGAVHPNDFDELITIDEACEEIGGKNKPISKPTFYRGVKAGIYGPIVHPSPGISRVFRKQLREAIRSRALLVGRAG